MERSTESLTRSFVPDVRVCASARSRAAQRRPEPGSRAQILGTLHLDDRVSVHRLAHSRHPRHRVRPKQLQLAQKRCDDATRNITYQLTLVTSEQQPEIEKLLARVRSSCVPNQPARCDRIASEQGFGSHLLSSSQFSQLLLDFFQFGDELLAPNALQASVLALAPTLQAFSPEPEPEPEPVPSSSSFAPNAEHCE